MKKMSLLLATPAFVWSVLVVPVLVFAAYLFKYSLNIPWFDDFENIPYFLQRALDAPTWSSRFEALLRPNNEHRVLYARLVVLMNYLLTGTLNFRFFQFVGNASFLVILILFYRNLRQAKLPVWYLLPVPFILFNAQNHLTTFVAMFSLQYMAIIMLVFLSIYQLAKNTTRSFGASILLALLTTFSMGNGMLVWGAGLVVLLYQRQWIRLAIWLAVMAVAVFLYFYGYPVQQGNQEGFLFMKEHYLQIITGLFVFVGGFFDPISQWPLLWRCVLPFVAGVVMVGFLAIWSFQILFRDQQKPTRWNAFLLGCAAFLIGNAVIIALFRTRFGFEMMLWGTYRGYALMLASVTYLIFIGTRRNSIAIAERWVTVFLIPVIGLAALSYLIGVPTAVENLALNRAKAFNQRYNQVGLGGSYNSPLGDFIAANVDVMQKRGWYELPQPAISVHEQEVFKEASGQFDEADWLVRDENGFILVDSQDANYLPNHAGTLYLILKTENRTYLWGTHRRRPSQSNPLKVTPGFRSSVTKSILQPGKYRLGVYEVMADGQTKGRYTNRFVTIE